MEVRDGEACNGFGHKGMSGIWPYIAVISVLHFRAVCVIEWVWMKVRIFHV